ncbi:GNAT family N-acetyltransferase [Bradyrhizobium yuanmingense]|uniref:GNAT family N-acetyltransferase n=2 Tax=Bradyrhizobium yuanmingense TaxID=108015 RepID=UPI003518A119
MRLCFESAKFCGKRPPSLIQECPRSLSMASQLFSASNDPLFPPRDRIFEKIVMDGHVWSARDDNGDYLGLAYAHLDDQRFTRELGGLMVVRSWQRKGVGSVLMRLTLGHLLIEETTLARGQKIIAYVRTMKIRVGLFRAASSANSKQR